jgi:tetratricopeptide (TPR) repeat protein
VTSRSPVALAGTVLLATWGTAFVLACRLVPSGTGPADPGLMSLLVGEGRQALSLTFFTEADRYFHKGVEHLETRIATRTLFQQWQDAMTPQQHAHAEGPSSAEILPWLKLAARADPRNIDAFLVSAFWAEHGLHRPDLAETILQEAQRLNPGDYRIPLEVARHAIRAGRLDAARTSLEAALRFQAGTLPNPAEDRPSALDRAEILVFLGFLNELNGGRREAINCFKNALAIFPERTYIRERIALLESGQAPPDAPGSLLKHLTRQSAHDACNDKHDDDGHSD